MIDSGAKSHRVLPRALLWISLVYGGAATLRRSLYRRGVFKTVRLPCPVISVGNLTSGGTGKTPMVAYLADRIQREGYRVSILSRGYQGKAQRKGGMVSDGHTLFMTPEEAGDEPVMLAQQLNGVPVIVGSNRVESGWLALHKLKTQVILLDDGFQHLRLARDLNLVLLDHQEPFGNGHLLPRGFLREPISTLTAADGIVMTRSAPESIGSGEIPRFLRPVISEEKPIFYASHCPERYRLDQSGQKIRVMEDMTGKRVVAFSGIAQNAHFRHSLGSMGCDIANCFGFPDHHPYTNSELETIWRSAVGAGACFVITTEKDFVRIAHRLPRTVPLMVIGVRLRLLKDAAMFDGWVRRCVEKAMGNANG